MRQENNGQFYYKSMMEYVACASVVPYKVTPQNGTPYADAFNAGGTFQHCWNSFAKDLSKILTFSRYVESRT